jgi:pyrroline-5-carboxylate reductase
MAGMKAMIQAAVAQGLIEEQPVEPLAHIIFGALHEAAMLIARSEDKTAMRQAISSVVGRLFEGLRGRERRKAEAAC